MAMTIKQAGRRYTVRVAVLMSGYVGLLLLAKKSLAHGAHGPLAVMLAALPALPIIGVFWALMKLLAETPDEYMRLLQTRQMMIATGFALVCCSIWGFLDEFGQAPHLPLWYAALFWFVGLGVGALGNKLIGGDAACHP